MPFAAPWPPLSCGCGAAAGQLVSCVQTSDDFNAPNQHDRRTYRLDPRLASAPSPLLLARNRNGGIVLESAGAAAQRGAPPAEAGHACR